MVQIQLKGVIGVESPSPRSFWCGRHDFTCLTDSSFITHHSYVTNSSFMFDQLCMIMCSAMRPDSTYPTNSSFISHELVIHMSRTLHSCFTNYIWSCVVCGIVHSCVAHDSFTCRKYPIWNKALACRYNIYNMIVYIYIYIFIYIYVYMNM